MLAHLRMETFFWGASEDAKWEGGSAISMQAATRRYLAKHESTSRGIGREPGSHPSAVPWVVFPSERDSGGWRSGGGATCYK